MSNILIACDMHHNLLQKKGFLPFQSFCPHTEVKGVQNRAEQLHAWCYMFHSCLFDLILYVPSTIFQLNRDWFPGLNQY